jgi:uncharacterized surface protein with fasciclin (FAS1) repeats
MTREEESVMYRFGIAVVASVLMVSAAANAQEKTGMAGGAMSKDVVDIAVGSKDHTTLVAAVKAAGLVDTLKGKGPFTLFAPTDAAFAKLPAGTVDTLVKPESKATLTKILTYHVVAGKVDAKSLTDLIKKDGGKTTVKTVSGGTLVAWIKDGKVGINDEKGGTAWVTAADLNGSNGVIHVVDTVLMPK